VHPANRANYQGKGTFHASGCPGYARQGECLIIHAENDRQGTDGNKGHGKMRREGEPDMDGKEEMRKMKREDEQDING
jgi:hypothetical protein